MDRMEQYADREYTASDAYLTALEDLKEALSVFAGGTFSGYLSEHEGNFNTLRMEGRSEELSAAFRAALHISETFGSVNPNISAGWDSVKNLCSIISHKNAEIVAHFLEQLTVFVEESQLEEKRVLDVAAATNEATEQILKELGLN